MGEARTQSEARLEALPDDGRPSAVSTRLATAESRDRLGKSTGTDAPTANPLDRTETPLGLRPNRSKGKSRMTAKPSSRPCKPTALGRRFRITVSALALSAVIGLGAGASPSFATVGSVYFDASGNAAAGGTPLFNGTLTGTNNVGLGQRGDAQPHQRQRKRRARHRCVDRQFGGRQQRRHRRRRAASPTPPATTTSRPGATP